MRGGSRANDSTLRWALVGGMVIVVVIATIVAITGALNGNSKKTSNPPHHNGVPATGYCLYPKTIRVLTTTAVPYSPKVAPAAAVYKTQLHRIERLLWKRSSRSSSSGVIALGRSGAHFVYINLKGKIVLGTPGAKSKAFKVKAQDAVLNGKGNKIIYQKTSLAAHSCAKLVLMEM